MGIIKLFCGCICVWSFFYGNQNILTMISIIYMFKKCTFSFIRSTNGKSTHKYNQCTYCASSKKTIYTIKKDKYQKNYYLNTKNIIFENYPLYKS